jgi:hypothetical protein
VETIEVAAPGDFPGDHPQVRLQYPGFLRHNFLYNFL